MKCPTCSNEMIQLFTSSVCEKCKLSEKIIQWADMDPSKMGFQFKKYHCVLGGFIDCYYNHPITDVFSIMIPNRNVPGNKHHAKWHFAKEDVKDAVNSELLLFKKHEKVWFPMINCHGIKGSMMVIEAEYDHSFNISEISFRKFSVNNYKLILNWTNVQKLHAFWKSNISP